MGGKYKDHEQYLKYQRDYRTSHVEELKKYRRVRRIGNPELEMIRKSRQRARQSGIEHTISISDFSIPTHCPVLGIELEFRKGCVWDGTPSLDRIDSTKGYIPGNVHVISYKANTIKSNATVIELQQVFQYFYALLDR